MTLCPRATRCAGSTCRPRTSSAPPSWMPSEFHDVSFPACRLLIGRGNHRTTTHVKATRVGGYRRVGVTACQLPIRRGNHRSWMPSSVHRMGACFCTSSPGRSHESCNRSKN
ncbi:hypothetical protein ABZP36_015161 [Zizania latifolia]